MLSRGLRSALGAINRPMPTKKAGRGADEEAKLLFDRDADNVLKSSLANLSKKDLFGDSSKMNVMEGQFDEGISSSKKQFDNIFNEAMEGGEVDLQGLLEIVPNNEVADSIINKLTGDFKLSIDEVKDLARVYSMSDVPNQRIMGELMTGFLSNDKAMGALGGMTE